MSIELHRVVRISLLSVCVLATGASFAHSSNAQTPEMQQKLADVKQAAARNKQLLAQYTWVEQDTISLKGEEKKQENFQVQLGPDGKPQKTALGEPQPAESGGREGRLKKHIVEKKTEEYKDYAESIKTLIQQYVPPEPEQLQQAYQAGNIMTGPAPGAPGQYRLVISNYIKQGDNMTLAVDTAQKDLVSLSIATYLSDPSDAVNVSVEFSRLPDGPNHVASESVNGLRKQLTIVVQNSTYKKM